MNKEDDLRLWVAAILFCLVAVSVLLLGSFGILLVISHEVAGRDISLFDLMILGGGSISFTSILVWIKRSEIRDWWLYEVGKSHLSTEAIEQEIINDFSDVMDAYVKSLPFQLNDFEKRDYDSSMSRIKALMLGHSIMGPSTRLRGSKKLMSRSHVNK
jgi:hypothetical protein